MFSLPTLETNKKVTKEIILNHVSQETIFEHYLGIPVKKGLFCSPNILRKDRKPTCSFYKNSKGDLIYKDFADDKISGNFISIVMIIFSCDFAKALRIIANDFKIIENKNLEINPPKIEYSNYEFKETTKCTIQVEIKEFTEKELLWWDKQGVSKILLDKYKVFSLKSVFLNGQYFCSTSDSSPAYGYFGGIRDGVEFWRIYFPTKKTFRFLSNWTSHMIQGVQQIPKSGKYIVVTKSLKDVMALSNFGIVAIAPTTENLFMTECQFKKLKSKFNRVFIVYDNDLPGIRAMNKIRKSFDVEVFFIPRYLNSKDFSDLVKNKTTLQVLELIEEWRLRKKL